MKLGIYAGSFNPVHNGHIEHVKALLEENILDKVIIVATGNYWDKNSLVSLDKRIEMLKFFQSDDIIIEEEVNSLPYTVQIMNALSKRYESDELYLIIGADNLEKFHLWKNVDELLKYKVLVINRNGYNTQEYIDKFKEKNRFMIVDSIESIDISSTSIRKFILEKNYDKLEVLMDKRVIEYIKENKLYEE